MNNVKPVILAGGLGSRLRPYTWVVPKPLLPIGERPIIECQLMWLRSYGFREVGVALGYRGDLIRSYLDVAAKKLGMKVLYVQEDHRLGTTGPLGLFKDWLGDNHLLSVNGDLLTKINLEAFANFHIQERLGITIASRYHETKLPFGVIKLSESYTNEGAVDSIDEKPTLKHLVSAGLYLLDSRVVQQIPEGEHRDMTTLAMEWKDRLGVNAYVFEEPWIAVEHMGDFNEAINGEWIQWADSLEHRILQLTNTES